MKLGYKNRYWGGILISLGMAALPLLNGCGNSSSNTAAGTSTTQQSLPAKGKIVASSPPATAAFGMIYIDTTTDKEYIYDGKQWAPHGKEVDTFYKSKPASAPIIRTYSNGAGDSCTSYDCNPGGAHSEHSAYNCTTCHMMHGGERFDTNGPAAIQPTATNPNPPQPGYNPIDKSCSNIACHSIPAGTFSYYFIGGDGEPELRTVSYGGSASAETPSWYANGAGCGTCHGNPPANYFWHSGQHATGIVGANECQFCHPDASGTGGHGTTITNAALHKNGTVEVQARFTSRCFACH